MIPFTVAYRPWRGPPSRTTPQRSLRAFTDEFPEGAIVTRIKQTARRRPLALIVALLTALTAVLAMAAPAGAHTPVHLDARDTVPWRGPLLLDGQSPTLLFGTLPRALATRSAQFTMQAGEEVDVSVIVPNLAPENQLDQSSLPIALLVAPDGTTTLLSGDSRIPITTESGMNLLLLKNYSAPAIAGTYSIVVTGLGAARFALSMGIEGLPFAGLERGSVATKQQVQHWYATPPAGS